ncbi:MAG: twin-arginine translocase TatA/TatE family subunit [Candidatus Marinimicrobia bacterium]|nr:twin-arginine translocase TatA/TatE family subunit [Candidatus Neomarinimicrobiota bacterium]
MSLGFGEILVILFIVLLLFGAKRLPDLARGLGQGMREFKKATNEIQDELTSVTKMEEPPKKAEQKSDDKSEN